MAGKCSTSKAAFANPQELTLEELAGLAIGEIATSTGGCCPNVPGITAGSGYDRCVNKRGFKFPRNGEFQFVLGEQCGLCTSIPDGYGCECSNTGRGDYATAGKRPAVKRIKYTGDPTECCTDPTGRAVIDDKTCAPELRGPSAPQCAQVMRTYCDDATNFFKPECKQFLGDLNSQARNVLASKWCANSKDDWCACFRLQVPPEWQNDPVKQALVRCLDSKCQGGNNPDALKPWGLTCPSSYVDCKQEDVQLKLLQSGVSSIDVSNKCGAINVGGAAGAGAASGDTASPRDVPAGTPLPAERRRRTVIIAGVVAAVLVIVVTIVLVVVLQRRGAPEPA